MELIDPANRRKGSLARPKRPLSAFNMFYRFKRRHVADAVAHGMTSRDAIIALIEVAPGLERCSPSVIQDSLPVDLEAFRRHCIREDLVENLLPRETRDRAHQRDRNTMNGKMGFVELGTVMRNSWKGCDEFAKKVFRELADEGRALYRQRMKNWKDATSRELVLRELAAKQFTKQFSEQASVKLPSAKQISTQQSCAILTNECSGEEREPQCLAVKDFHSRDGSANDHTAKQPSSKEGQPANTCGDPALKGSRFCGGSKVSDMVRADSGFTRERFMIENNEAPRPSNSHDTDPRSLLVKQPTSSESKGAPHNNTSEVPRSFLRNTWMDRSPFQERSFKQDESVETNRASPNDLPNTSMDRGSSFQGGEPFRSFSLLRQGAPSGSNQGSLNDPSNSFINRSPFQAIDPPVGRQNEEEEQTKARVRELEAQLAAEILQARVRKLEEQLAAERLEARVRELTNQLTSQRTSDDWLTRQVESFSRNCSTAASVDGLLTAQGGRWPLLSAILRIGEDRNNMSSVQSAIHFSSNSTSNKRQRPD